MTDSKTKIIAVCGKGGVGKTSISSLLVKTLMAEGGNILAIDADPAVGFATALGVTPGRTVNDIRTEVIEEAKQHQKSSSNETIVRMDYSVFEAMIEEEGFAFLAIGRPETEGCYCKVNDFLRVVIEGLAARFDYVIIDGEAGIEQINRRVMERVTHLLLVSDASHKGINVIKTIRNVADSGVMDYDRVGVILNRLKSRDEAKRVDLGDLELIGVLTEDDGIRERDIEDESLLGLPDGQTLQELHDAMVRFGVIEGK